MSRTYSIVNEMANVDIWVMDPSVRSLNPDQFIQSKHSGESVWDQIQKLKSFSEVEAASGFSTGSVKAGLPRGGSLDCLVIGLDELSFLGAPNEMEKGRVRNLAHDRSIIIDELSARDAFSYTDRSAGKASMKKSVALGNFLKIGKYNSQIVGISKLSRRHYASPVIYTTLPRAAEITNRSAQEIPFILIKSNTGTSLGPLCAKIEHFTGLKAFTKKDFSKMVLANYLSEHQIPYHFAWVVAFGFMLALAISGATLLNVCDSIYDDLRIFKTIGASKSNIYGIMGIVCVGTAVSSFLIGLGLYLLSYLCFAHAELVFTLSLQVVALSGASVLLIATLIAGIKAGYIKELYQEVS